jgi:hypothetical protein
VRVMGRVSVKARALAWVDDRTVVVAGADGLRRFDVGQGPPRRVKALPVGNLFHVAASGPHRIAVLGMAGEPFGESSPIRRSPETPDAWPEVALSPTAVGVGGAIPLRVRRHRPDRIRPGSDRRPGNLDVTTTTRRGPEAGHVAGFAEPLFGLCAWLRMTALGPVRLDRDREERCDRVRYQRHR